MKKTLIGLIMLAAAAAVPVFASQEMERKVRHELIMLPYYGVFDNLTFQMNDGVVTLAGQVTRPALRSDAENVVKRIEGVERVVNNIGVLPLSSFDDSIRLRALRSIYGSTALSRYGWVPNSPVRIIVKHGQMILEGVVANENDKNVAFLKANGVSGTFKVTNNLRVE